MPRSRPGKANGSCVAARRLHGAAVIEASDQRFSRWVVQAAMRPPDGRMENMEKVVRVFDSFEEADGSDAAFRSELTPGQRVDIFFEIRERARNDAAEPGFARVCRVLELEQS